MCVCGGGVFLCVCVCSWALSQLNPYSIEYVVYFYGISVEGPFFRTFQLLNLPTPAKVNIRAVPEKKTIGGGEGKNF